MLFSVVACYILACYGGGFSTLLAYVADTFSAKNIGRIYGKMLLARGAAGIVGPMLIQNTKKTSGDFKMAIVAAGG